MFAAALKKRCVLVATGCVLVTVVPGCSSDSKARAQGASGDVLATTPATSVIKPPSIPGIGATRADWDASHTRNAEADSAFDSADSAFGDDPSLPSYLAPHGAIYTEVSDLGTGRIQVYGLNLRPSDQDGALARARQELPPDATLAWVLSLDKCYRATFNSETLRAAGPYMAEVQLEYAKESGSKVPNPDRFNRAVFTLYTVGTSPNPDTGC